MQLYLVPFETLDILQSYLVPIITIIAIISGPPLYPSNGRRPWNPGKENPPRLERTDAWGKRVDRIWTTPAWKGQHKASHDS